MPLPLLALLALGGAGTAAAGSAIGAARRSGKRRNPLEEALDAQVIDEGPGGAFLSALETIGRPGHIINNLAIGNWEGAGRQAFDTLGDAVDFVMPGDWIPHISRRMDKPGFSEVLGGMEPGFAKTATDVVGGIATDPTNLIPGKAVGAVAKGAVDLVKRGVSHLPEPLAKGLGDAALATKETLGWLNPTNAVKKGLAGATALRSRATRVGSLEAERIMGALPENLQVMIGDAIDNLHWGDDGVSLIKEDIGRRAGAIEPIDQQLATLRARVAEHPDYAGLDDVAKAQVDSAIEDSIRLAHTQYLDDLKHGALAHPKQYTDPSGKTFHKDELEEMFRQEKSLARPLAGKAEALAGKVHDLDVETKLANRLANQKGGQVTREIKEGTGLAKALQNSGDPNAVMLRGGVTDMDPYFPRLFNKLRASDATEIPRSEIGSIEDLGETIWKRGKRKTALETGPSNMLKSEFRGQATRDQTLAAKQADLERLKAIDPGEFDDFVRGRGLSVQDVDVSAASPRNYLQRLFEFPEDAETAGKGALADAQKSRKLTSDADLAEFLNNPENAGVAYERNAYKRLLARSGTQGRMLQKARIAKQVLGNRFTNMVDGVYTTGASGARVYDKSVNAAVDDVLNAMAKSDPESSRALANAYHGLKARGPVLEVLAKANRYFKPAAVYGVVIPKMGSIVRNDLGTSWQILSEQGVKAAGKNLARTPRRLWDSINDGLVKAFGLKRIKPSEITHDIDLIEEAHRAARGAEGDVMAYLKNANRPDLAEAARHGVLDGFVSMEKMLSKSASDKWWKRRFFDIYDAPAAIFQGVEQRARLANFLDQYRGAVRGDVAAKATRDSMLDYTVGSTKNRTLRDLIPFAAFQAGSVKQQAKFLGRNPGVAGGLSRALEQDPDQQVYPYMEGKLNVPIGTDAEGNKQFASGFGLPFEALNQIPNPSADMSVAGRQIRQNVVGASQPLIKSALSATFGIDPYFGTPYGSYSKLPVVGEAGDLGRAYNKVAGTGMIQPLDTALRTADDIVDPRHGPLTKALDLLTGTNVVSVDQDRALQQRLQQALETNPQVAQHRSFYDRSGDPETQALLHAYNAAKARNKAKRVAQEAATAAASDPGTL